MAIVFRIVYSLAVAILYILFVIFGVRTLYSEPDYPQYPNVPAPSQGLIYCEPDGDCYRETFDKGAQVPTQEVITPAVEATLTETERSYLEAQRTYNQEVKDNEGDRRDYFRNVFGIAAFFGVVAIAGGVAAHRRIEAMPLGLVLGGIGSLSYGWVEWERGPDDAGTAAVFVIIAIGLALVLAGGYWFMGGRDAKPAEGPKAADARGASGPRED